MMQVPDALARKLKLHGPRGPILVLTAMPALLANSYRSCNLGGTGLAEDRVSERTGFSPLCAGLDYRVDL